jgi:hypothetical protein
MLIIWFTDISLNHPTTQLYIFFLTTFIFLVYFMRTPDTHLALGLPLPSCDRILDGTYDERRPAVNALIVSLLSVCADPAIAQEGSLLSEQPPYLAVFKTQDEGHHNYDQLSLGIRIPFLGGEITDEGPGEKWTDFFKSAGFGLSMRGAYLWSTSPSFALGPYVGLSFDWFSGDRQFIDDGFGGFTLEPDTLFMMRSSVGLVLRENLGRRIMLEQYIGIGFALYNTGFRRSPRR